MVVEIYGAWERLNVKTWEMEVYSAAYALMAGGKGGHSVSKRAVERGVALGEVL